MSRIVRQTRTGKTGLYIDKRYVDNIDSHTGEQTKRKQVLVFWPDMGLTRWMNAQYIEVLEEEDSHE